MAELPEPTADLGVAKRHMDEYGYCLLKDALGPSQVDALYSRVLDQLEAEVQIGMNNVLPDKKQLVRFLLNKGQVFRDIVLHQRVHDVIRHVLGQEYLLSAFHAHIAHPGTTKAFHTDQFWMPQPTNERKQTLQKPGSVTRAGNRGHHVGGGDAMAPTTIAPAVVCNTMWMLDDFTAENGATLVVPGSHLNGRQPDHDLDSNANWVSATAPAGTVLALEGRLWHSTGVNTTNGYRTGLTINFCAPQFRQQENFLLGTLPAVVEEASSELLALMGFKAWQGYGGYENHGQWVARGEYALGELVPEQQT
ncbi:MAG: phytanoyl-CoA dioxygenase family protein [Gammaproteobacteria bacterium]|nr:phytanoyl-CoA dioxygenase family protein [Gammaproteobacteria bacterium]